MREELEYGFPSCKMNQIVTGNNQVLVFDNRLHGQTLATVTSAKYFNITIHKEASRDSHTDSDTITAKANKTRGFLRHSPKIC